MPSRIIKQLIFVSLVSLLLSGCVVGRRTVDLNVPQLNPGPAKDLTVNLADPVDQRVFQNKPSDPSTPSIDGDVNTMSASEKATMIGRQRNGYGMAMGDVALPEGMTVSDKMKQLVRGVFEAKGYQVGDYAGADYDVSVDIQEFWGWFTPGMFTVKFEARVMGEVTIEGPGDSATLLVTGYGLNNGQIASDANWQLAYQRAFEDFIGKLTQELNELGF